MKKIKVAVIGVGYLGEFHADKYHANKSVDLIGVVDLDRKRRDAISKKLNISSFSDYTKVLDYVDAVSISVPTDLHFKIGKFFIENGKHVLIEKPMALTKQEVESITQAAKDNNVIVMEGFMYVFHPQFDFVLDFINSGKLGKIQYAHSMFSFPIQPTRYYRINRSMKNGGGAFWDIGPYAIHTLRQVMGGHIKKVNSFAKMNSHQADMSASGILEFTDQRRATFDISFECTRRSEFEIFGEIGRLKCHTVWQHENDEAIISYELDGSAPVIEKIQNNTNEVTDEDTEVVKQIKELIDQRVRPAVAMDGGDISFCSFQEGVVTLQMKGACAGCPSSTATLKMGIENMLRHYIPEVLEVKAAEL